MKFFLSITFLLISGITFSQKRKYSDSALYYIRFDSAYIGLHIQTESKALFTTYNKIYPGNVALNKYNLPGPGKRFDYISFEGQGKLLPPFVAKKYFALVPKASRKFHTYLFWTKANRISIWTMGVSAGLFLITFPFYIKTESSDNDLLHYRVSQAFKGFGITCLSALLVSRIAFVSSPRPLRKAAKYYNEEIDKLKKN